MYDNWINNLSESYIKNRLGINEEDTKHHPLISTAAQFLHKKFSRISSDPTSVENHAKKIKGFIGLDPINHRTVADAAAESAREDRGFDIARDHYTSDDLFLEPRVPSIGEDDMASDIADEVHDHLHKSHPIKEPTNESTNLFEQLNDAKEYAYILEHVLNTLLEHEVINEEIIMEVLSPWERFKQAKRMGLSDDEADERYSKRQRRLSSVARRRDELRNDPSWDNTVPSVARTQFSHARRILKGADFPHDADRSVRAIDRMVPEGSPEEADVAYHGLHAAGLEHEDPEIDKTAIKSIRSSRRLAKQLNADYKRRAREREQGK